MARKFLTPIDLTRNELQNAVMHNLGSEPLTPAEGLYYYDPVAHRPLVWDGTVWGWKSTDSDLLQGHDGTYYKARANHTGTQTAATISDFDTQVRTSRLDQMAAPTVSVSFNSQKITNLDTPTADSDAATKAYVDGAVESAAAGIDSKPSVRVVAVANVALTGLLTIDGITLVAGERALLTAQTDAKQNGVYVAASGAWTRATDADNDPEISPGAFWFVEEGTLYGKSQWRCSNSGTVTIGTTNIAIDQFGAAVSYSASNGVQLVGNDFSAKVVSGGGILAASGGLSVDPSIFPRKFSQNIGDGSATDIVVTHNLGTRDVTVQVYTNASPWDTVELDVERTSTNTVTLRSSLPASTNGLRVVVTG